MTPDKYASRVWEEVFDAMTEPYKTNQECVAIISAALKRQREACARVYEDVVPKCEFCTYTQRSILNAEVDAPADSEVKHGS